MITNDNGETRREPVTQVQFAQLSLFSQLMHTVASPPVAPGWVSAATQ